MKLWLLRIAGFGAAFVVLTVPTLAHHARSGYDLSKTVTFKATVTKVDWMNPHALIYFDVNDSSGRIQNWHAITGGPSRMSRYGWTGDTLKPGDPITITAEFDLLRNDLAVARAFDNRIGTFAVAETLRLLKESKTRLQAEVCAVSNVQEEVGLLGARQIAYSLKPDVALVVDVTHATDYPTVNKPQHGDVKVGAGPTLTHGGCNHPEVVSRIEQVAKAKKIALQHEATSGTSGTDTDVIFWTRGGIASALVSLPNRYMHSPVEVVSLRDLEQIPQLLAAFAASLKKAEEFKVKI